MNSSLPSSDQDPPNKVMCSIKIKLDRAPDLSDKPTQPANAEPKAATDSRLSTADRPEEDDKIRNVPKSQEDTTKSSSATGNQDVAITEYPVKNTAERSELFLECKNCGETFQSAMHLINHSRICELSDEEEESISAEESFQPQEGLQTLCKNCGKIFETPMQLIGHSRTCGISDEDDNEDGEEESILPNTEKRELQTSTEQPQCKNCGQMFESVMQLISHTRSCEVTDDEDDDIPSEQSSIQQRQEVQKSTQLFLPCKNCGETFGSAMQLISHARNCEKMECVSSQQQSTQQKPTAAGQPFPTCKKCGKAFETATQLASHTTSCQNAEGKREGLISEKPVSDKKRVQTSAQSLFPCMPCGRKFESAFQLISHARICELVEEKKESVLLGRPMPVRHVTQPFACQICMKQFGKESWLQAHLEKAHGIRDSRYQCSQCFQTFHDLTLLQDHPCVATQGFGIPSVVAGGFECALCKLLFTSKEEHDKHWDESHGKRYPCAQCSKQFRSQADLDRHSSRHLVIACDICGKEFKYKSRLIKHRNQSHRIVERISMPCEVCGKLYKGEDCLKEHMVAVHNAPGRHTCSECGKHFWLAKRLELHMRSHTGEKPYECTVCGKAFALASSLYVHNQRHNSERKYECKLCNTSYKTKYYLKEHMNKHDPTQEVVCDQCGKTFRSKWLLKEHKEIHMDRRKYKCDVCGIAYNNSGSLYTHKKKHMSESTEEATTATDDAISTCS